MAIATLERCYNNPAVFKEVVKIRKGEAVKMMLQATNMESVKAIMTHFTTKVRKTNLFIGFKLVSMEFVHSGSDLLRWLWAKIDT